MAKLNIVDYLSKGIENRKTRKQLADATGMTDRHLRQSIEDARLQGHIILSSSHCSGYWISNDKSEIQAFLNEINAKIKSLEKSKYSADVWMYREAVGAN